MSLKEKAKDLLDRSPGFYRAVSTAYRSSALLRGMAHVVKNADPIMMGSRPIIVNYQGEPRPRWTGEKHGHPGIAAALDRHRGRFESTIRSFAAVRAAIEAIPSTPGPDLAEPFWNNIYFGVLDAVALYGMLVAHEPPRYFEVGSGNSTKLTRRAIKDQRLKTTILSIDPAPRAEVDAICDRVIRQPLEEVDPALFDELQSGDILFFDGSHHAFMNSDVVTFFLDILPRLKPGVLVHIHDIFLPYDYPADWAGRYYTEQYLLATALLLPDPGFDVVCPNQYIVRDPELSRVVDREIGPRAHGHAGSFWLQTRVRT
jgi:hypothetical protein